VKARINPNWYSQEPSKKAPLKKKEKAPL